MRHNMNPRPAKRVFKNKGRGSSLQRVKVGDRLTTMNQISKIFHRMQRANIERMEGNELAAKATEGSQFPLGHCKSARSCRVAAALKVMVEELQLITKTKAEDENGKEIFYYAINPNRVEHFNKKFPPRF